MEKVTTIKEAYKLAAKSPGTIVTDIPVYKPEAMGLEPDTKVLLFNDGAVKAEQLLLGGFLANLELTLKNTVL